MAFGSKAIIDRFLENGLTVKEVISIGDIFQKWPFVMQTLADVLGMLIKVAKADQVCVLGAAMFAAVVSRIYKDIYEAATGYETGFLYNLLSER
jgi:L-ribulokinase